MALNKVQRYLSILFFTSLIFTQTLIYVAVRAANNNELLQAIYIEPVSENITIGDSIYFQAMLSSKGTSDFDFVSFNIQNPQINLDENYQASLQEDGTWRAQSAWDTTYGHQPGQYYLSVVAYNYDNDKTTIYGSDYSVLNLNGEFRAAVAGNDLAYYVSPQEGVVIDPLDLTQSNMLIDFRVEESVSESYVQNVNFNIEDVAGIYAPDFYTATRGVIDNGYEVWSVVVDTGSLGDADYTIFANVLIDLESAPDGLEDDFNNIDNTRRFTIERSDNVDINNNPSSVNIVSPQDGSIITEDIMEIEVVTNHPVSSNQYVRAVVDFRGSSVEGPTITVPQREYILTTSGVNNDHHVRTVELGTGTIDAGLQGISTEDWYPNGNYSILFQLVGTDTSTDLGSVNISIDRELGDFTPEYTVAIASPSAGEEVVGNDLLVQLTTSFSAEAIDIHLLPENHEELAVDLTLRASATSNLFQTTISASSHGFINGNYFLSVGATDVDGNTADAGPIAFSWQITEEDPVVDPDLLAYQPSTSTVGPGDILIGSANVADVQFRLANASNADQEEYILEEVNNISCTNSILGASFAQLRPADHNFCFYASISGDIVNQLANRGNYNFYLHHDDNQTIYDSPPVLITYYNDDDQDAPPDTEFIFLRPQNNSTINDEFHVVIASNVDYVNGLEIELERAETNSSNYLSAARSNWSQASLLFGLNQASYSDLAFVYISNPIDSKLFSNGRYDLKIVTDQEALIQISINNVVDDTNTPPLGTDDDEEDDTGDNPPTDSTGGIVPIVTQPTVTTPGSANNVAINLDSTCVEQGITDPQACQKFQATIESLDQICIDQGIYDDQACEDYLYRIRINNECQENGIIDREECKNYLLEKYGSQVDCRLDDINLCNSVLRNRYLSRLVVGQQLSDNITKAVDPLIGKNISTQELSETLANEGVESTRILPLVANQETKVLVARAQKETVLEEENELTILNQAVIILDADGDGLSDDLEEYYGTDPNNPDTDGDGYDDGTEINNGYNPAGEGKLEKERTNLDKVLLAGDNILEQPKTRSVKIDGEFKVDTVDAQEKEVKLFGQAEANKWITLYLYSDLPLVMTTKTDASGNWSYDIKHSLTDGHHKVYVTVNDDTGKIVKQSRPISFLIREAQAVTVDDYFDEGTVTQEVNNLFIYYILGGAFLVFLALGILLFIHKDKKQNLEV